MIDNFNKILPLLKFDKENFYFLQILQRKKDYKHTKVNGCNNNSRLITAYYIYSEEYFNFIKPEIIELCNIFNARASINLNRRNFEAMSLQLLRKVADQIMNKSFDKSYSAYNSVVGAYSHETDKTWILDIDEPISRKHNDMIRYAETECRPEGDKFITIIPSKNGSHILMKPFDINKFKSVYPDIEIHKNNPTNLYIP